MLIQDQMKIIQNYKNSYEFQEQKIQELNQK